MPIFETGRCRSGEAKRKARYYDCGEDTNHQDISVLWRRNRLPSLVMLSY